MMRTKLETGRDARMACRMGALLGTTAAAHLGFCQLNPKPCPLIGVSELGNPRITALGHDLDVRTDLPCYRVWEHCALVDEPNDITSWWREDLVAFVIGCSYSFEQALLEEGLPLRHVTDNL